MDEELDRHFLTFPAVGPPVWVVQKSEGRLTDEHLARLGVDVNRRDDRAAKGPPPVVSYAGLSHVPASKLPAKLRGHLKLKQCDLFPVPDVDENGRKRNG